MFSKMTQPQQKLKDTATIITTVSLNKVPARIDEILERERLIRHLVQKFDAERHNVNILSVIDKLLNFDCRSMENDAQEQRLFICDYCGNLALNPVYDYDDDDEIKPFCSDCVGYCSSCGGHVSPYKKIETDHFCSAGYRKKQKINKD